MDYIPYESYYLDDAEFYVLLAGEGCCRWYGPGLLTDADKLKTADDVHMVLAGLYQKGIVEWKRKKAVIREPYRMVFKILHQAEQCILARKAHSAFPACSQYVIGDRLVSVEKSCRDAHGVRLTYMSTDAWIRFLQEQEYFPENIQPCEDGWKEDYMEWKEEKKLYEYCLEEDVTSVFEKIDVMSGKAEERLIVQDTGLSGLLYLQNPKTGTVYPCSESEYIRILKTWAGSS